MTKKIKTVKILGDFLTIRYDGNMWVSPSDGSQHARAGDAMKVEIEAYYAASGEDAADCADEIESAISNMVDD